jgi:N-methylhydantoinase A
MSWTIGVDVGGTFTDFHARDGASGREVVFKRPSTPADPGEAILSGLAEMAEAHDVPLAEAARIAHGTTVATNALIQRKGASIAAVATKGFRDLLEIGRQVRPHMYDLNLDKPEPLAGEAMRFEVAERLDWRGEAVLPLTDAEAARAAREIVDSGADAVAICFLFAYRNPAHEQQLADAIRKIAPAMRISLSSDVQPEFREYERFQTTAINAYLQPLMAGYVERLATGLDDAVKGAALGVNQSSGGLMSAQRTASFPVRTALSGPAAGAVGAAHIALRAGRPNVVTLDMGGTSADVALIEDGRTEIAFQRDVAGFPIRLAMVDIDTVGAGGGSIAWFDRDGLLKVGPISAGAVPGPACYGQGGTEPTVTDANLVLGRLSPTGLLDGAMPLDPVVAETSLKSVAEKVGVSLQEAALGVLAIAVANMTRSVRRMSVERGRDPREFVLMAFGGAGALHAREVAAELGMGEVLVPPSPGIVCAEGLLVSDQKEDFVASLRLPLHADQMSVAADTVTSLAGRAAEWFDAENLPGATRTMELALDLRYVGQNFELIVPVASAPSLSGADMPDIKALANAFFTAHDRAYGFHDPGAAIEIVNFRMTARGRLYDAEDMPEPGKAQPMPEPTGHRPVWFDGKASMETPIYRRETLAPGMTFTGPAIIDQLDATTPVHPGDTVDVRPDGSMLIALKGA